MKKRIALLGALSALFTAPVYGYNVASVMLNSRVLDTVKQTGTTVVVDGPRCQEDNPPYGSYVIGPDIDMLTICSAPHASSPAELKDTIRHEAWHIVQVCNGGPIYKIDTLLHRSTIKNSATSRQTFSHFHNFILKISRISPEKWSKIHEF